MGAIDLPGGHDVPSQALRPSVVTGNGSLSLDSGTTYGPTVLASLLASARGASPRRPLPAPPPHRRNGYPVVVVGARGRRPRIRQPPAFPRDIRLGARRVVHPGSAAMRLTVSLRPALPRSTPPASQLPFFPRCCPPRRSEPREGFTDISRWAPQDYS